MTVPDTALVVGAGESLGAALARRFAREGLKVAVARRNAHKLEALVAEIRAAGGAAHAFGCDARREGEVAELFARVEREVGALDLVVFNYWAIHRQKRSAWTFEADLRRWVEPLTTF